MGHASRQDLSSQRQNDDHVLVELIEEPAAVARYIVQARKRGVHLSCARCEDEGALITAILVLPLSKTPLVWALCGDCQSEFPRKDTLFYRIMND